MNPETLGGRWFNKGDHTMMTTSDFKVGDKVMFGRGQGEQTLGEVVKVNRKKLKVKQLESRGTQRNYAVGSVWTVPPSLCSKMDDNGTVTAPATPAIRKHTSYHGGQSPREMLAAKGINKGDIVEFTFRRTTMQGRIKRINAKTVSIVDVDNHRYPVGVYATAASISHKIGTPVETAPMTRLALAVGTPVTLQMKNWDTGQMEAVPGIITLVGHAKGHYEVFVQGRFIYRTDADVTKTSPRSDADVVSECLNVYGGLSPENLACDGEASRTHIRSRSAQLNRALKALWKEAGRQIDEGECYESLRSA